jgi:hypothetical protein
MVSRSDADTFYRSIGFEQFSPAIPTDEVRARARLMLSAHDAGHLDRLASLVEQADVHEYFEVSEHATSPEAVALLAGMSVPSVLDGVLVVRLSDNQQRPYRLDLVARHGYTARKYRRRSDYAVALLQSAGPELHHVLERTVCNVPPERLRDLLHGTSAEILFPMELVGFDSWTDVCYCSAMTALEAAVWFAQTHLGDFLHHVLGTWHEN